MLLSQPSRSANLPGRGFPDEKNLEVRKLSLVLVALLLTTTGCGAANDKPETAVLRSSNPLTSDLYIRISGPAGAVDYIADGMMTGAFIKKDGGFFVPPQLHQSLDHERVCSINHVVSSTDSPSLQAWRGKRTTIAVYGNKSYAAIYCRGIGVVFASGA